MDWSPASHTRGKLGSVAINECTQEPTHESKSPYRSWTNNEYIRESTSTIDSRVDRESWQRFKIGSGPRAEKTSELIVRYRSRSLICDNKSPATRELIMDFASFSNPLPSPELIKESISWIIGTFVTKPRTGFVCGNSPWLKLTIDIGRSLGQCILWSLSRLLL